MSLEGHLNISEAKDTLTSSDRLAVQPLLKKGETLDVEFKEHYYAMIDLASDDEQVLDERTSHHGRSWNKLAEIIEHLQELQPVAKAAVSVAHSTDLLHHLRRQLNDVQSNVHLVKEELDALKPGPCLDSCLLLQLEEQVGSIRIDLSDVIRDLLSSQSEDEDQLDGKDRLHKSLFQLRLQIKRLFQDRPSNPWTPESESQVKLQKIDIPTYDGNILHWNTFSEQLQVSIHSKTHLTNVKKLAYLRDALKGRSVGQAIEGLSWSADQCKEAIGCLKRRYDQPRLVHGAHVRASSMPFLWKRQRQGSVPPTQRR